MDKKKFDFIPIVIILIVVVSIALIISLLYKSDSDKEITVDSNESLSLYENGLLFIDDEYLNDYLYALFILDFDSASDVLMESINYSDHFKNSDQEKAFNLLNEANVLILNNNIDANVSSLGFPFSKYTEGDPLSFYFTTTSDIHGQFRVYITYEGSDWIFFDKVVISINDNNRLEYKFEYLDIDRKVSNSVCRETTSLMITNNDAYLFNGSNQITILFYGDNCELINVSEYRTNQINALIRIYEIYTELLNMLDI